MSARDIGEIPDLPGSHAAGQEEADHQSGREKNLQERAGRAVGAMQRITTGRSC
jgi:hypothetical protein